jgi:tetratricopeptide (TPR) repeat protein
LTSRHFQALAGLALALGGTLAVPTVASAQYNRVPDPNATRVLVAVFRSGEKGMGVQAADAVRSRMNSDFPFKQVYVLPKTDINATLEASGFPITDALEAHDQRALATLLRADEYVTGTATKTATGVKVEANLVLARDNALVQPVGSYDAKSLGEASSLISKELKEARKQLDAEKKCINAARSQKYDEAIAAAKEGIVAYPKATLARICWANVMITQKAPAEQQLAIAKEIVAIDPRSRPGLAILASSYRALKQQDSAVVTLTRLLSTDPKNPRLQKEVVEELASVANPRLAKPVVDTAVMLNPGDPDLLKLRWRILLATRDYKEAFAQGEELVKLDTSFADTAYFSLSASGLAADSQYQQAAEMAAKGLAKFPNEPGLTFTQIVALQKAGQNQQALEALDKAIAAKTPVETGSYLRVSLLKDLNRSAEILPAAREMIAAGDTTTALRQMVVGIANDQRVAASKSNSPDDFAMAVATLKYADSVTTGASKAQAQFLLGATYVAFGQLKLSQAQTQKVCAPAKEAKDMFVEAQIMLPKGGATAVDAMRQLMGAVMQLDPAADQMIKAFCK